MDNIDRLMMKTEDLAKERLAKIKELYPDLFTQEGRLDPEELKKLTMDIPVTEKFGFRWYGKDAAKRNAYSPSDAAFVYDKERSVNPDIADGNLIIEGENLECLKLLLCAYRGKIKMIYIDPPYNTGNDFVYNDDFKMDKSSYLEAIGATENGIRTDTNPETSGRYHSNWMSMMFPRLLLARELLRDDGVIFVSIDDNEVHHLRIIMNEVFGEENFVATFSWKRSTGSNDSKEFFRSTNHEYLVTYAKSMSFSFKGITKDFENYINPDNDPRGAWARDNLTCNKTASQRPNLFYPITDPKTGIIYQCNPDHVWRFSKDKMIEHISNNKVIFPQNIDGSPTYKRHLSEVKSDSKPLATYVRTPNGKESYSEDEILEFVFPINMIATRHLKELIGGQFFDYPKSHIMIKKIIEQSADSSDLILDFFAGSGTTAQAVLELNKEDGGNRKFILVHLKEATDKKSEAYKTGYKFISDITIERVKRVMDKMTDEEDKKLLKDGNISGFKVYKITGSNFPRIEYAPDPEKTEAENIELLKEYIKAKENTLTMTYDKERIIDEVLLKNGFMLNYTKKPVAELTDNEVLHITDGNKEALICLDKEINKSTVKYFMKNRDLPFICLELSLNTENKMNLDHFLGEKFIAY
jgi:adenine-specific DNA-methyltransferase